MAPTVVSLLPAATEIVASLGITPAGISHTCDYPPAIADQPVVTGGDPEGGYRIDEQQLAALRPDVLITQGVCADCAVDTRTVQKTLDGLESNPTVVTMHPHTIEDLFGEITEIGAAIGREQAAADLIMDLRSRLETVASRIDGQSTPSTLVLDWIDPIMAAGHWVPELVELAGGRPVLATAGETATPYEWATIREADPAVLVVAPCDYTLEETAPALDNLRAQPGWESLQAIEDGRVYAMDGHDYVNQPGPRLVATAEYLGWILHPETFDRPPTQAVQPLDAVV